MAKLVYRLNQSLDGYVDHDAFPRAPSPKLFLHFTEQTRGLSGSLHGRRMYEAMRYWDQNDPAWTPEHKAYASAWQNQPKWVVSRSLKSVGPNATLIADNVEAAVRRLKAEELPGEIQVGGPELAGSLSKLGLIDEYQLYIAPFVLGRGKPFFTSPPAAPPPDSKRSLGRRHG